MDMAKDIKCPKCGQSMLESSVKGHFTGRRNDGLVGGTETVKYMCTGCGYIEERDVNPFFLQRLK